MRLRLEVRILLRHLVECWHELVRSKLEATTAASTNRLEGRFGLFKPWACLARDFGIPAGPLNFVRLMAGGMV